MVDHRFVIVDRPDNTYSTGRIIDQISDGYFLVQFDCMNDPKFSLPIELIHASEMISSAPDGLKYWRFFESEDARRKWLEWVDSPSPSKVINLVKK